MTLKRFDISVDEYWPSENDQELRPNGHYVDADVAQGLYDALEGLSPHCTGYGPSMDWSAYNEAQKKARKALSKARGEQG